MVLFSCLFSFRGYNIGVRLVDEFFVRANMGRCKSFEETANMIAKVGFKMFLGQVCSVPADKWNEEKTAFSLVMEENPLGVFVELPSEAAKLKYSNVLCGVLRGALEMVQMRVECDLVQDSVHGDHQSVTEIRVVLKEILADEVPVGEN